MGNEAGKRAAGFAAAQLIAEGMTVGIGTGSTAAFFITALGERMRDEGLRIRGAVPTSRASEALAIQAGIPLLPLGESSRPDITIDGADEIGPGLALIKGGGGALVREKLVAASSKQMVVIADRSKAVGDAFGAFPLPVAIFPYGWMTTRLRIADTFPGIPAMLRKGSDLSPFTTDDGLYILDMHFGTITDPAGLEAKLRTVVGVAEVGLFVGIASRALIGGDDGGVTEIGTE